MTSTTASRSAGAAPQGAAQPSALYSIRSLIGAWAPAVPLLVVVVLGLVAPAAVLVVESFTPTGSLSLDSWTKVLGQPVNQDAIRTSIILGFLSASVSVLIGTPMAWLIHRMLPGSRAFWLAMLNVAANFGGIGLAFGYLAVLGTVGMLTIAIQSLGIPFVPPRPSSMPALLIAYTYTNVPLFILLTIPAMSVMREDWWEAAQVASATRRQFWRSIGLPVLLPFIAAGFLLIFTWSIGIYGIAYGLAGQSGATGVHLITLQIGTALQSDVVLGPARAGVLAVVLMAIATTSLLTYRYLLRRALRWF